MNTTASRSTILLGTVSLLALSHALPAHGQQTAQAQIPTTEQLPEQVLVTGSLIHGTAAVGVPVTTLGDQDFKETGALTIGDLLKDVPAVQVLASVNVTNPGGNVGGGQRTAIHGIGGGGSAARTLLMVDGRRTPNQNAALCSVDASIIPQLAIDRLDVLADGASATYGSDAVSGVLNVILKRGYDGAITQFRVGESTSLGGLSVMGSQLYGRKWETGDVTLTYEAYHNARVQGPGSPYLTYDYSIWGLDNRIPLVSASPGIASTGKPTQPAAAPAGFDPAFGTSCSNCFSIPKGQNGVGLTWASILANPGVQNEYNPYKDAWFFPDSTRNAAVFTFDQELFRGDGLVSSVKLYGEGFYNNRRQILNSAGTTGPAKTNALQLAIPTINPYYPIGAPTGLMVAYNFSQEIPGRVASGEIQGRWELGLSADLPADWKADVSYTKSEEHAFDYFSNKVNVNLANAALGRVVAASGAFVSYTKPANIPYLNVFCDPGAFKCNYPATLAYISSHRTLNQRQVFNQANATFDGPLFGLPGGLVRGAIGGDYLTEHFAFQSADGSTSVTGDAAPNLAPDQGAFTVWAAFAQLNVPFVGEANSFLFVRSLELELSGRIDHYSNVGTTKNPKIALNWNVGEGLIFRGTWGTSFRAPNFNEVSTVAGPIDPINVAGGANGNTMPTCPVVGKPAVPNTAAAILNPNCTAALQFLGGISLQGSAGAVPTVFGTPLDLRPETARNWAVGFNFAPTEFLNGIDLDATLYDIKVNDIIQPTYQGTGLSDPITLANGLFVLNTDPNFAKYVAAIIRLPAANPLIMPANISFIANRLLRNVAWEKYRGVDFSASYVLDLGDLGTWNTGITGNYVLDLIKFDGANVFDSYKKLDSGGRLNYRARLGWAGGPDNAWSVTTYANWHAHYGNLEAGDGVQQNVVLPPACFMAGNAACNTSGLPQFAQYTNQYAVLTNYEPAWVTVDLSIGYKTGDRPANEYLRNLGLQIVVNNFLNKKPNFAYALAANGGSPRAYDVLDDPSQRVVTFIVTKVW